MDMKKKQNCVFCSSQYAFIVREGCLQSASNLLKEIVIESGANPKSLGYNEFAEIALQLIKPLPSIFKEVQVLSIDWIKKESERIKSQLEIYYCLSHRLQ